MDISTLDITSASLGGKNFNNNNPKAAVILPPSDRSADPQYWLFSATDQALKINRVEATINGDGDLVLTNLMSKWYQDIQASAADLQTLWDGSLNSGEAAGGYHVVDIAGSIGGKFSTSS